MRRFGMRGPEMKSEAPYHHVSIAIPSTQRRCWNRLQALQRSDSGGEGRDGQLLTEACISQLENCSQFRGESESAHVPTHKVPLKGVTQLSDSFEGHVSTKPLVWCLDGASCRLYVSHSAAVPDEHTSVASSSGAVLSAAICSMNSDCCPTRGSCDSIADASQKTAPEHISTEGNFVLLVAVPGCVPFSELFSRAVGVEGVSAADVEFVLLIPRGKLSCKCARPHAKGTFTDSLPHTSTLSAEPCFQTVNFGGDSCTFCEDAIWQNLRSAQTTPMGATTSDLQNTMDMPHVKQSCFLDPCHSLYSTILKFKSITSADRFLQQLHGLSLPLRRPFLELPVGQHAASADELSSTYPDPFNPAPSSCSEFRAYSWENVSWHPHRELHPGNCKMSEAIQSTPSSRYTPWIRATCYALSVKSCSFVMQNAAAWQDANSTRSAVNFRRSESKTHTCGEGVTNGGSLFRLWELPLCPVCLERVDAAALGFQTHLFGWDGSPELLMDRLVPRPQGSKCSRYSCARDLESGQRCVSFAERAAAAAAAAGCATCSALLFFHSSDFQTSDGLGRGQSEIRCSERRSRSCNGSSGSAVAVVSTDECTERRRKASVDSLGLFSTGGRKPHCGRHCFCANAFRDLFISCSNRSREALRLRCQVCFETEDLWLCLVCGHSGCGRYKGGHAKAHSAEYLHRFCINVASGRVWDYAGDAFVHRHLALPRQEAFSSESNGHLSMAMLTASLTAPANTTESSRCGVCYVDTSRSFLDRFSSLSADEHEQSLSCPSHARKDKALLHGCGAVGTDASACDSRVSSALDGTCFARTAPRAEAEATSKRDCRKWNAESMDRLASCGGCGVPCAACDPRRDGRSEEPNRASSKEHLDGWSPEPSGNGVTHRSLHCNFDLTGAERHQTAEPYFSAGTHLSGQESYDAEEHLLQQQLSMVLRSQLEYQRDIYETRMWIEEANLVSELELLNAQTASVEERIVALQVELADVACRRRELAQSVKSAKSRNANVRREIVFLEDLLKEMSRQQDPGIADKTEHKANTSINETSTIESSRYTATSQRTCPRARKNGNRVTQDPQARRVAALDATIARLEQEVSQLLSALEPPAAPRE